MLLLYWNFRKKNLSHTRNFRLCHNLHRIMIFVTKFLSRQSEIVYLMQYFYLDNFTFPTLFLWVLLLRELPPSYLLISPSCSALYCRPLLHHTFASSPFYSSLSSSLYLSSILSLAIRAIIIWKSSILLHLPASVGLFLAPQGKVAAAIQFSFPADSHAFVRDSHLISASSSHSSPVTTAAVASVTDSPLSPLFAFPLLAVTFFLVSSISLAVDTLYLFFSHPRCRFCYFSNLLSGCCYFSSIFKPPPPWYLSFSNCHLFLDFILSCH